MSRIARYDFRSKVASFDFFTWLVHVQAQGATEIVFDKRTPRTSKWGLEETERRYRSVLKEGPVLAGLPSREGTDGECFGSHNLADIAKLPDFKRLQTVKPAGSERYTVTLRRNSHRPERDSNENMLIRFKHAASRG